MAAQCAGKSHLTRGCLCILSGLILLCLGCNSGGQSGELSPQAARNPALEQQAVEELLALYRTAILQEDIDRLQELLQSAPDGGSGTRAATRQEAEQPLLGAQVRDIVADAFRQHAVLELRQTGVDMRLDTEPFTVAFQETWSVQDPTTLEQRTQVFRTTWELSRDESPGAVVIRIAAVRREGPVVEVITPGQILANAPTRIVVTAAFDIAQAEVEVPATEDEPPMLVASGTRRLGIFTPPLQPAPEPLRFRVQGRNGEVIEDRHHYRLRIPGEGVVQRIAGTGSTSFFAVAVAPDGTVWGGGDAGATLYQVVPGASTARLVGPLLAEPLGRVSDLTLDQRGRLHAVVVASQTSGVIVGQDGTFCQTVNVLGAQYPFRVQDLQTGTARPSPSTRARAAGSSDIWVYGSDGGVARVADTFQNGQCPEGAVEVRYSPVFRREDSDLLSNTVAAFVPGADGTLWFGTALGLTRQRDGQFTPVLFRRDLALPSAAEIATLEAFFATVAEAIFNARPLSTVALGNVSFTALFGRSLVKEDIIFSAVEDGQGDLWAGTLGGGLRRISTAATIPQDSLHLTRKESLGSNIIFALAVAPDQTIWAATEEGVSHLQPMGDTVTVTNFSALDGLALPVRDVAIDGQGVVWLATAGGLFRILPQGGSVQGTVLDLAARPVVGADIVVEDTPFRAVTDTEGRFTLMNLPPGPQRLQIDGAAAVDGPFMRAERDIVVTTESQPPDVRVVVGRAEGLQLVRVTGDRQTGLVATALPEPLVVRVIEATGQPVPGVSVMFSVAPGSGQIVPSQPVLTDAQGQAAATLTLGPQAGPYVVTATGLTPAASSGLAVTFTATAGPDRAMARLVRVAGNNQSAAPGVVLPLPLVVRLEDQFGNPVVDERVTAALQRGQGVITAGSQPPPELPQANTPAEGSTDASGEVRFALQAGDSSTDIVVEMAVPALPQVTPVQFLTIVGMVDIGDIPLDLAVQDEVVYVAAGFDGLQVIDGRDARTPQIVGNVTLVGVAVNVAVASRFAYVATFTPTVFTVLDLVDPLRPVVAGSLDLDAASTPVKIVVRDTLAYVALEDRSAGTGTLAVLDVATPDAPRLLGSLALASRPTGLTVEQGFAYIPAGTAGLLVIDVRDAVHPALATSGTLPNLITFSGIVSSGTTAYLVESEIGTLQFRVIDLRTPGTPVARGMARLHAAALPFTASTLAVADGFAYVASFDLGLQVFDVHEPETPRFVGGVATPSVAFNVATAAQDASTFIYVTDLAVGLNIVAAPPANPRDTDGDGVIDFFDAFPAEARETLDTDGDGTGDNADADDDNDGALDTAEIEQDTDPRNPRDVPITPPVLDSTNTLLVDAAALTQDGDGSTAAPYRSISAALRAVAQLRDQGVTAPLTVAVRAGIYSTLHTGEAFPLFFRYSGVTLLGTGADSTTIDAAFFADVMDIVVGGITIDGVTLQNGVNGLIANAPATAPELALRRTRIADNLFLGLSVGGGVTLSVDNSAVTSNGFRGIEIFNGTQATLSGNTVSNNGEDGILLFSAMASITDNTITANGQDGVQVTRISDATIRANDIGANFGNGILVDDASTVSVLQGNIVAANGSSGIIVQVGSAATITDNDITDHRRETFHAGILVSGTETRATVRMNRVAGNSFGIAVQQARTDILIEQNTVRDSVLAGILVTNNAVATVLGNVCTQNSGHGLLLFKGSATINEGMFSANGADGIRIQPDPEDPDGSVAVAATTIAKTGAPIQITSNAGDGIHIEVGSGTVQIDRDNIIFQDNGGQEIVGMFEEL